MTDTFTVTSQDGTATGTVTVTITGTNDAATVSSDSKSVTEGDTAAALNTSGQLTITDPDSGEAHVVAQTNAAGTYGDFSIDADGAWTYTGNGAHNELTAGQVVTDTFTVTSQDGTATGTVTVTITGTNDAATVSSDSKSVTEGDTAAALNTSGQLTITDPDSGEAHVVAQTNAAGTYGDFSIDADGAWTYTGNGAHNELTAGQVVTDTFTVTSQDGTATGTVTVTITGTNDAATVSSDSKSVTEGDTAAALNTSGQLTITDPDSGEAHVVAQTNAAGTYGDFSIDADGAWTYTGNGAHNELTAGQVVTDTFTVTSQDGTATGTVTVTITGTNDAATVSSDSKSVTEGDTAAALNTSGQLTITDPDSGEAHVVAQTNAAGTYGDFSIDADGAWTYTGNGAHNELTAGQVVTDTFTVTSQDGTATGTVTVTITGTNDAATVSSDSKSVTEGDTAAALNTSGQLTITDPDSGEAHVVAQTNAAGTYGDFSIDADGAWTYTGNGAHNELTAGQVVTDTFTVTSQDGTATGTVTVTITGTNDAATVSSDSKSVTEGDTAAALNTSGQLTITDPDSGEAHVVAQTNAAGTYGDFSIDADGAWTYTGNGAHNELTAGQVVTDTFTVTSQDGTATGTVTVTITGTNDAATVSSDSKSVTEGDTAAALNTSGQLTITDPDSGEAHVVAQTNAAGTYGDFSIDADGAWTYTGNGAHNELTAGQVVTDTFTVTSQDGTATGTVTVTITGTNDAATVSSDSKSVTEGDTAAALNTSGQLTITDPDSGEAHVVAQTNAAGTYGDFSIDADGAWTYTGNGAHNELTAGQVVTDTFTVTSQDGTATGTVTVTITGTNDAATVSSDSKSVTEGDTAAALNTSGQLTITDPDSGEAHVVAQTNAAGTYGDFSIDADGAWTYTGNGAHNELTAGQVVTDTFTVTSQDGTATGTVTVTITGTNDAATVSSDSKSVTEGDTAAALNTSGQLTITDPDSGEAHVVAQTNAAGTYGDFSIDADGAWTYTGNGAHNELTAGQVVTDTFTVTSQDGTATGTVTVTITGTNDAATVSSDSKSVTEGDTAAALNTSGQLTITDPDSGEAHVVAQTNAAGTYGDFSIDADGAWTYTGNGAHNELTAGQVVTDTFTVTSQDGTATGTVTVTITGTNDAATVSSDSKSVTEGDTAAALNTSGQLTITDPDSGEAHVVAQTNAAGTYGDFSIDADGAWTYTGNGAHNELTAGQVVTDTFTVTSQDGTATGTVTVTITGTNDAATVSSDSKSVTEGDTAAALNTSGQLTITDPDSGEAHVVAQTNAAGTYGDFSIDADGAWTYTGNGAHNELTAGQVVTDTFTVTSQDGTATGTVTVTITGTNDAATVSSDSKSVTEGDTAAALNTSGQLTITDPDSGEAHVVAQTNAAGTYGDFSIDADGAWTYTGNGAHNELTAGQVVTDTFTVTSQDGTATGTVTVTITGTNDAATVSSDSKSVTEGDTAAALNTSGQLTITDPDSGEAHVVAQTNAAGTYGDFSIDADGAWTYTGNGAHNELTAGQVVTDTFTVTSQDGTATGTVTVTITGTNDAATVSSDSKSVTEGDTAAALNTSGQLTITDPDSGEAHVVAQTNAAGTYGDFSIDADGAWTYTGNGAHNELTAGQVVTDTFTVTSQDGTATGTVTVTITGTNDAATVSSDSKSVTEGDTAAALNTSGQLTITDPDSGEAHVVAQTNAAGTYGDFSIDADGAWTYTGNGAHNELTAGQVVTDTFTVTSQDGTATGTVTVTITGTNDAAVLNAHGGSLSYTENQAASAIDAALTASDVDSTNLTGATVSITANFASGQDVLGFTTQNGITGSYNAATGVLTLSGTATVAQYQAALDSVTYFNSSDNPSGATRTISYQVDDGQVANHASNIVTSTVAVTPVNDAPVVVAGHTLNYTENQVATAIDPALTVSDVDSANLSSATVQITGNYVNGQDVLGFTNQNGITGSFNAATGTLTLTGSSSVANYQTALDSVTYFNTSDNPSGVARTVTIITNDGSANSLAVTDTINVTPVNDAPVVVAGHTLNYTENQAATAIDPALTVSDVDSANLSSATVQITGNYVNGQDVLGFTNQNGITGSFNAVTGTLTLTGSSSVANYQIALDSVTYLNTSDNPSGLARTVTIITNDGSANSLAVTDTINVTPVNDAPVVVAGHTLNYTENQAATAIDPALTVSDVDSANLSSATVQITGNYVNGQDVLGFTNQNGITGSFNAATGTLTLTGSSSVANYQTALDSVTYLNTSDNPSGLARTVTIITNDGTANSVAVTDTINVTPVNDAPVLTTTSTLAYTENQAATAINTALTVTDADNATLTSGTVSITANFVSGQDVLAFTNVPATMGNITGAYNSATGVMTLTSAGATATLAQWQAAERAVTYANSSDNPSTLARTVTYTVDDGQGVNHASNGLTSTINITAVNDAPALTTTSTLAYTENQAATAINTALTVTDADNATLTSGTVSITANFVSGQDVLAFTNVPATMGNITGAYNSATGVMTLTSAGATATLAQWQAAERAVTYANSSDNPSTLARTVTYTVDDGQGVNHASNGLTSTINITAVNDAPALTTTSTLAYTENQAATAINTALTVTDADNATLTSGTVSITANFVSGQDVLAFTNVPATMGNITGAYNSATGVMTLTSAGATATLAQWQAAERAVTYANSSDNPSTLARTVTYTVDDGQGVNHASNALTSTINITAVNDAPVNTVPGLQAIGKNNSSVVFSSANGNPISISDVDVTGGAGTHVETVTLSLSPGFGTLTLHQTTNLTFLSGDGTTDTTMTFSGSVTDINSALNGLTYNHPNGTDTTVTLTITTNDGGNSGTGGALQDVDTVQIKVGSGPAGVSGQPINLGLVNPSADHGATVEVTIADAPQGWAVSGGTANADNTWTVVTNDVALLSITSPVDYVGALVLKVSETWTNADGSVGNATVSDNVEAYTVGSPIFALSGDDTLTASSGHDLFVFSQPIGHDVIYSFDATSDQIDLIGYANFTGFGDIQAHMANDAAGNAVITLADGQSITLNGVDAASLSASDFVFDQTPVTENAGHMVISDGAILPLSGIIDNTGTIELNSTGDETDLQLIEHGITLQGGGHVDLSDSSENVITGTVSDVTLTNVDNTISGAGHLGDGVMVLVNEGTIIATGTNALDIDTGANAVTNSGTIEATGTGGLEVHSDIINTGVLWANGGNVTIDGNISGAGTAQISGSATLEFGAASSANVTLDAQATGTIVLHDSFDFSGVVSGFNGDDNLDLLDVAFGADTTASYVANQVGTGGTLSVTDGVHTANITLLGQYDPAGFQTEADKTTGTLISYHDHLA
ncbi:VCBS repeat-containing protein [Bradyrhizobium niftali]